VSHLLKLDEVNSVADAMSVIVEQFYEWEWPSSNDTQQVSSVRAPRTGMMTRKDSIIPDIINEEIYGEVMGRKDH